MRHISITGPDGTTVQLEGQKGLYAETALDLRGAKPSYTLTGRGLTGMTDSSRETTLEVKALGHEGRQTLDGLVERGHAHAEQGKPCTIDVDGWKQTAYIPTVAAKAVDPIMTTASLTLCLLEGIWRKPSTTILSGASANGGVDYPHDYPHDYAPPTDSRPISLPVGGMSALAGIVFQGPATSPYLRVGRNIYQVKASVPAGGLITVDPITRSVTVTQPDGTTTDAFAQAVRGNGLGSENYIFEPLPEGTVMASVSGCALAQLTVWGRRLTPPWDEDGTPSRVDEPTPVSVGYGAKPQLASTATVHWSDWQTTTEPITWTNIPDTSQAGATLTATGVCAGLVVMQRILVQPDLFDASLVGQSAFENGPNYDSRWDQQSDGGWTYNNPSDSGISEYAGRSFGGHMGGANPDVDSRLLIPAGDYTLVIPVISASGFPVAPAPHSIGLSYRISSDGEKWNTSDYYRAQWWTQPNAGSDLRMKVHAEQSGYFGLSLSFNAIPGTVFQIGKPMLLEGTLANAAGGGSSIPDLTGVGFTAGSTLPDNWESGNTTSESTPYDVTPANYPWAYKVTDGGFLRSPQVEVTRGEKYRVTIVVGRWTEAETLILNLNFAYTNQISEPVGKTIRADELPVGQWTTKIVDFTVQRGGLMSIFAWSNGGTSIHIASISVECAGGGSDLIVPPIALDSAGLPPYWNGGEIRAEAVPESVTPRLYEYAVTMQDSTYYNSPDFQAVEGEIIRVTLVCSHWAKSEINGALSVIVDWTGSYNQPRAVIKSEDIPVGAWKTFTVDLTVNRTQTSHIFLWSTTVVHIASLTANIIS